MEASSREARRKKIREGESDRIAVIMGRAQNLPSPNAPSTQPHHQHTASTPSFPSYDQIVGPEGDRNAGGIGNKAEHQLRKCDTNVAANRPPPVHMRPQIQPMFVRPKARGPPVGKPPNSEPPGYVARLFNPKHVSSCIMASENTRAISSAMIALLVVLSYIDFAFFGRSIVSSESIVTSRPLYMLLLTDVIIVFGRLVLEKRRGFVKVEVPERAMFQEDAQAWAGAVRVMETGLVVHQSIRAIFIDCSIYAVFLVCGLSLL